MSKLLNEAYDQEVIVAKAKNAFRAYIFIPEALACNNLYQKLQ